MSSPSDCNWPSELGADHTINAATDDPVEILRDLTGGRGADRIVECTGNTKVLRQALDAMATDATVAIVGAPPFGSEVAVDVLDAIVKGPRIVGVNQGRSVPRVVIPALVDLYLAGRLPFDRLIRTYPFDRINDAAHDMHAGTVIKPVLLMPEVRPRRERCRPDPARLRGALPGRRPLDRPAADRGLRDRVHPARRPARRSWPATTSSPSARSASRRCWLARHLCDLGYGPGDVVVVQLPNIPEFIVLYLALQHLGCVPLMALPPHREHEIGSYLEVTDARAYAIASGSGSFDFQRFAADITEQHGHVQHVLVAGEDVDPPLHQHQRAPRHDTTSDRGRRAGGHRRGSIRTNRARSSCRAAPPASRR